MAVPGAAGRRRGGGALLQVYLVVGVLSHACSARNLRKQRETSGWQEPTRSPPGMNGISGVGAPSSLADVLVPDYTPDAACYRCHHRLTSRMAGDGIGDKAGGRCYYHDCVEGVEVYTGDKDKNVKNCWKVFKVKVIPPVQKFIPCQQLGTDDRPAGFEQHVIKHSTLDPNPHSRPVHPQTTMSVLTALELDAENASRYGDPHMFVNPGGAKGGSQPEPLLRAGSPYFNGVSHGRGQGTDKAVSTMGKSGGNGTPEIFGGVSQR